MNKISQPCGNGYPHTHLVPGMKMEPTALLSDSRNHSCRLVLAGIFSEKAVAEFILRQRLRYIDGFLEYVV